MTTEQPTAPDWPSDAQLDAVWVELCSFGAEPPYKESADNPDHADNRRVLRDALAAAGITAPTGRLRELELTEAQVAAFAAGIDTYKERRRSVPGRGSDRLSRPDSARRLTLEESQALTRERHGGAIEKLGRS